MFLSVEHPNEVVIIHYLDDVLAFSTDGHILQHDTLDPAQRLEQSGWIVSPKSELAPSTTLQRMGKHIDGHNYMVRCDTAYLASLIVGVPAICTTGYHQRQLRQLLGRILWAPRPGSCAMPFPATA